MKLPKRSVFRVEWNQKARCWGVLAPGKWGTGVNPLVTERTKADAVVRGALIARRIWEGSHRQISQLVVHCKDGHIAFERTYGRDPKRTKG